MGQESKDRNQAELEIFKHEIDQIVEGEAQAKTAHFKGREFKSDELTLEDMDIWAKVKKGTVTRDDFDYYRHRLKETNAGTSRMVFKAFVANKATPILGRKEMEYEAAKEDPRRI